jgi:hypothetical protein
MVSSPLGIAMSSLDGDLMVLTPPLEGYRREPAPIDGDNPPGPPAEPKEQPVRNGAGQVAIARPSHLDGPGWGGAGTALWFGLGWGWKWLCAIPEKKLLNAFGSGSGVCDVIGFGPCALDPSRSPTRIG